MRTWPFYSDACIREVSELLKAGGTLSKYRANKTYGVGPQEGSHAWKLEREIEKKFNVKHAIAVNSGTAALHAALVAIDVRGRDVVTSPYTFSATASAILLAGGRPVFADVDPCNYCITKESVRRAITKRTAAILPVHLFGYMADVSDLKSFGLPVLEDACQAVGARRGTSFAGTVGIAGAYSFNGSKNVCAGEGGCLVTNDDQVAQRVRLVVNHSENFGTQEVGYNYRVHEVVALIACHGLKDLDERNKERQALAGIMGEMQYFHADLDRNAAFVGDGSHVFYCYPFTINQPRKPFIEKMAKRGYTIGGGYISPTLNKYKAFRKYAKRALPVVERLSNKTLCLAYDLVPGKPESHARGMAKAIQECLS